MAHLENKWVGENAQNRGGGGGYISCHFVSFDSQNIQNTINFRKWIDSILETSARLRVAVQSGSRLFLGECRQPSTLTVLVCSQILYLHPRESGSRRLGRHWQILLCSQPGRIWSTACCRTITATSGEAPPPAVLIQGREHCVETGWYLYYDLSKEVIPGIRLGYSTAKHSLVVHDLPRPPPKDVTQTKHPRRKQGTDASRAGTGPDPVPRKCFQSQHSFSDCNVYL